MQLEVRPMCLDDLGPVRKLWEASPGVGLDESDEPAGLAAFLRRNPDLSVVGVIEGQIIAAVLCGHDGRRGYLSHLAVAVEHRKSGIARRLVTECLERLAAAGLVKCNLRIYRDNASGLSFWNQMGWTLRDDVQVLTTYTPAATRRPDPRGTSRGTR
jgi:ribosomal protein S18 acetylase RimI-like enzyme